MPTRHTKDSSREGKPTLNLLPRNVQYTHSISLWQCEVQRLFVLQEIRELNTVKTCRTP